MRFLLLGLAVLALTGCARDIAAMKPNHVGLTPSCEWEIQKGNNTKVKPKVQTSLDWNF